jgi:branched-chain amino acid transport system substrate-binding protein
VVLLLLVGGTLVAIGPLKLLSHKKTTTTGTGPTPSASTSISGVGGGGPTIPCNLKIAYLGTENSAFKARDAAEYGGMQLALAQYSQKHSNCPVSPARFDTNPAALATPGSKPARDAAKQLVADPTIVGVIGPATSADSLAAMQVLNTAGIPEISPSATNDSLTTQGYQVFHRAIGARATLDDTIAAYVAGLSGAKVFLIDDGSPFGIQLSTAVRAATAKSALVGTRQVAAEGKQTNFSNTVSSVVAAHATVVVYGGYSDNAGRLLKQLRARSNAAFIVGDIADQPSFLALAGPAADSATVFCQCSVPAVANAAFSAAYAARFGSPPDLYADVAYDATNMLLAGLTSGAATRSALLRYLATTSYKGIANTYSFTSDGRLDPVHLLVYRFSPSGSSQTEVTPTP